MKNNKVKRLIAVSAFGILAIAGLVGCAATIGMNGFFTSQSDLQRLLSKGTEIEIVVAEPSYAKAEQGTEKSLGWEELASLTTTPDLREPWDNLLLITNTPTGKNGLLYVDAEGNNEPNNTLFTVTHNREFQHILEDETLLTQLADAATSHYVDLDPSTDPSAQLKSFYAGVNSYFNLLPDNETNYANVDSTLTRGEFMAMMYRSTTPVQDLTTTDPLLGDDFTSGNYGVTLNPYAEGSLPYTYLTLDDGSLTPKTYTGKITRAEAIYALVQKHFKSEYDSLDINASDIKSIVFEDAKNAGNPLDKVNAKSKETVANSNQLNLAILSLSLSNPSEGLPEDLYKSLLIAQQHGLISTTSPTRWDESLTLSEATEWILQSCTADTSLPTFSFKQGLIDGYTVSTPDTLGGGDATGSLNGTDDSLIISFETTGPAEEKYQKAIKDAEELLADGLITKDMYDKMIKSAKSTYELRKAEAESGATQDKGTYVDENGTKWVYYPETNSYFPEGVDPNTPAGPSLVEGTNYETDPSTIDWSKLKGTVQ